MSNATAPMGWVAGYEKRTEGTLADTFVVDYSLTALMQRGYIARDAGQAFLDAAGLRDFYWQITYFSDFEMPDEMLVNRLSNVQGYVVWVHGWTGNHAIWEELPSMTVCENPNLVSIAIDHNGFGKSIFIDEMPSLENCNPPAAMRTLQAFVDLIKIRRQPGESRLKVVNFVGHSMGGATLFYLNPMVWNYGEVTRSALAPALLLEDEAHRRFYQTLGLGIGLLQRLPVLDVFERVIKPSVLSTLATGATELVKELHSQQYNETPRGITGATFMAMGRLKDYEIARDFDLMRVILGHRDPLVGLVAMVDLLGTLEFPARNIHVVPGTHYMFSVGKESPTNALHHAQTREMVVMDVCDMHYEALERQKSGRWVG